MHAGGPGGPGAAGRGRRIARRVACAAIAVAAVVMCGLTVEHGFKETISFQRPAAVQAAAKSLRTWECTYRVIREDVPKGARVFVADYWQHAGVRLTDLQTGWSIPEAYPGPAQYQLHVGRGRLCSRQMLTLQRR